MTQPTTQAIEKAREIAAACWNEKGLGTPDDIIAGRCDNLFAVQAALRALSAAASKREQLEARVKELELALLPFAQYKMVNKPAISPILINGHLTPTHFSAARAALEPKQ